MGSVLTEILLILLLLAANGVFAMTEIAIVAARKARLRMLAAGGNRNAKAALELAESPNRFLSTVQIGITLVGILAGAFGGATIARQIAAALQDVPPLAPYGQPIGLAVVVLTVTFLSLVIGELLPKRIGLANPEGVAMLMAIPMQWLSRLASPAVNILSWSTELLLRLFGARPVHKPSVDDEEVRYLMQEGLRAGAFNAVESQMVDGVLQLDKMLAREIMTPRPKIIWLSREDTQATMWHKVVVSGHSHFPVYEGNRDNVVGIVALKSIYANVAAGVPARVTDLMTQPLLVPASQNLSQVLDTFRQKRRHIALVADEFGGIAGLVTLHDIMEAIIGELPSADERARPAAVQREDKTWLIDGLMEIDRVKKVLPAVRFDAEAGIEYQTLGGFVVKELGHLPREGETVTRDGYVFEVLDMDHHRVDKVLVTPAGAVPNPTGSDGEL
jgi:putative hemolysin